MPKKKCGKNWGGFRPPARTKLNSPVGKGMKAEAKSKLKKVLG